MNHHTNVLFYFILLFSKLEKKNIISLSVDVGCKQQFMLINARSLRKLGCDQTVALTVSKIQTPHMHARFAAAKITALCQADREKRLFCRRKKNQNFPPTEITDKRKRPLCFPSLECVRRRRSKVYNEGKRIITHSI